VPAFVWLAALPVRMFVTVPGTELAVIATVADLAAPS
jgi:hypothetical protein